MRINKLGCAFLLDYRVVLDGSSVAAVVGGSSITTFCPAAYTQIKAKQYDVGDHVIGKLCTYLEGFYPLFHFTL